MSGRVDLECREVVELVTEYLSHALSPESAARFEQHLFTCPPCTTHLHQMKTVIALSGALHEEAKPPGESNVVALDVFRRWKRP